MYICKFYKVLSKYHKANVHKIFIKLLYVSTQSNIKNTIKFILILPIECIFYTKKPIKL